MPVPPVEIKNRLDACAVKLDVCESRFRSLVDLNPDGMAVVDRKGNTLFVNRVAEALLGKRGTELIGKPFPVPIVQSETQVLDNARNNGEKIALEIRTNEIEWDGEAATFVFLRDVTEMQNTEKALREAVARLSTAFRASPALLGISTLEEGIFREVNEAFVQTLGYQRGEIIGKSSRELNLWKETSQRDGIIERLKRNERVRNVEVTLRCKDGTEMIGLFSAEEIELGGERCLLTAIQDITSRKEAEERLRRSESQLAEAQSIARMGSWEWELATNGIECSEELFRMLGIEPGTILPTNETLLQRLHPDDRELIARAFREAVETLQPVNIHFRIIRPDGEMRVMHSRGRVITSESGWPVRMVGTAQDVTELRRVEEEIEILNTNLACRAAELESANRELEAFGYTVSHDLRSPLSNISGFSQVMLEVHGRQLSDQCRQYLGDILEEVDRMDQLITTIMDFSCLTQRELSKETVDLGEMAHAIACGLRIGEPARRVNFVIAEGMTANGDRQLLKVMLDNLIGNAWKYTSTRESTQIEFGMTEVGGTKAFFVRDNGVGFDMADAERLFTPFSRLHGGENFKGHGIGLATVRRIIRRHGGRVWAEGKPGEGAVFYFTIP